MTFPIFLAQAAETNATDSNATDANSSVAETNVTDAAEQVAEVVVAEPTWLELVMQEGAIGLLIEGGFFMWPLLILAIVGLAVVIERWRSLKMLDSDGEKLRQKVIDLLSDDNPEDALNLCESERGPVAAMLSNGLRKYLVLKKLGHDHTLHCPEETEHGSNAGNGSQNGKMSLKGRDNMNAIIFHALNNLIFNLGLIMS